MNPINSLFCCDCLDLLERLDSQSVDLAYIDPPVYSGKMTLLLQDSSDEDEALRGYLKFFSRVIQQTHRVLKATGNLIVHVQSEIQNYLRIIIDQVFGRTQYQEEYLLPGQHLTGSGHTILVRYTLSEDHYYVAPTRQLSELEVSQRFPHVDTNGRYRGTSLWVRGARDHHRFQWGGLIPPTGWSWRYPEDQLRRFDEAGLISQPESSRHPLLKRYLTDADLRIQVGSIWNDLGSPSGSLEPRLGLSQRPLSLLERIIGMASRPNDTLLDPFCGTGTTIVQAQLMERNWIACDSAEFAISTTIQRLEDTLALRRDTDYWVVDESSMRKFDVVYRIYQALNFGFRPTPVRQFVLNHPLDIEETRHYEFKEIKGKNPAGSIEATADEYAVAFLNSQGGRIFWGIRDSDRVVVGVQLNYKQRDRIRQVVIQKLHGITPTIAPSAYQIEFHPVTDVSQTLEDTVVVELVVPRVETPDLFFTSSGDAWVKTDSGKKKLNGAEINLEIQRRQRHS